MGVLDGKYTTSSGTTYTQRPHQGMMNFISSSGKAYDTLAAAESASEIYNQTQKEAVQSSQQRMRAATQSEIASRNNTEGDATNEFLQSWGKINDATLATYNDMIAGLDVAGADSTIRDLITDIKQQSTDFSSMYGGLESEAVAGARSDVASKRQLTGQLMAGAETDYAGVEGRTAADITGASEAARSAEAREMMSYGADPTSGEFGAMTRKSFMDEARNKTVALNLARRGEKERATGAAERAYGMIDPSESAGIASGIASQRAGYTGMAADLGKAESDRMAGITSAKTDIAGRIADMGRDYGSIGATQLGINTASGNAPSSVPSATVNTQPTSPSGLGAGWNNQGLYQ